MGKQNIQAKEVYWAQAQALSEQVLLQVLDLG